MGHLTFYSSVLYIYESSLKQTLIQVKTRRNVSTGGRTPVNSVYIGNSRCPGISVTSHNTRGSVKFSVLTSLSLVRLNKTAAAIRQADLAATGILEAQDKRIEVNSHSSFFNDCLTVRYYKWGTID